MVGVGVRGLTGYIRAHGFPTAILQGKCCAEPKPSVMQGTLPMKTPYADSLVGAVARRDAVRIGCLTALGLGLHHVVRAREPEPGASVPQNKPKKIITGHAKSCILLWLDGGPSHLETFDLKPDAPAEVRGPFQAIQTNVMGITWSELLPRTASVADKLTVIRSMTSPLGEHGLANHYLLTGYKPSPVLQYPSYGSVLAHTRAAADKQLSAGVLPRYVAIPNAGNYGGAGFLGTHREPFATGGDPAQPLFRVCDLDFYPGVTESRIHRRRALLADWDNASRRAESKIKLEMPVAKNGVEPATTGNETFEQAYRLITSPSAKQAFDLTAEPARLRERYGPRALGQSCLLARRLVERGVPFVTVVNAGWDTHENLTLQLRDGYAGAKVGVGLVPTFDQAFATLIEDLHQRGMLAETLVIAMGEFGRTPKLNTRGGRDHWPRAFSVVLAGGGIAGGQIIGASDRYGESPHDQPITPNDLARAIYTRLGVDPEAILYTSDGRPVTINQEGTVPPALL